MKNTYENLPFNLMKIWIEIIFVNLEYFAMEEYVLKVYAINLLQKKFLVSCR